MEQKRPLLTSILAALTVLFLAVGIYYWRSNRKLIRENDANEQRADSLLSAKLRLEGDVRSLDRQLETATDENASLEKRITILHTQLNASDRKLGDFQQ